MEKLELNKILIHGVPNICNKQYYLQGCYFESKTYKDTCDVFKRMKTAEQFYAEWTLS